jgi:LuxR family maltose regulon positive regulatory protein
LAEADDELVDFLGRTSVLFAMSPPYCDDVLDITDSATRLREAERATLLVTRFSGADDGLYRMHPLLREHLVHGLEESQPQTARLLNSRAARWCDANGFVEDAIAHASRSQDLDLFGELVWKHAATALVVGRHSTVRGWLAHIEDEAVAATPALAITAAWSAVLNADGANALRWADATRAGLDPEWRDHLGRSSVEAALGLLLALPGTAGYSESAALAGAAYRALPATHAMRPFALFIHGTYLMLSDPSGNGRAAVEQSRNLAASLDLGTTWVGTSGMLTLFAVLREAWPEAQEHIAVARRVWREHDLDERTGTAWMFAVSSFLYARAHDGPQARRDAHRVESMISAMAPVLPWLQVIVHSFLARAYGELDDQPAGAAALRRAHDALDRVQVSALLSALVTSAEQALARSGLLSRLTPAELRLWPYLMKPATLGEIASDLQLSRETVKSQLGSIYRKLGVSSRRELQVLADALGPS